MIEYIEKVIITKVITLMEHNIRLQIGNTTYYITK